MRCDVGCRSLNLVGNLRDLIVLESKKMHQRQELECKKSSFIVTVMVI